MKTFLTATALSALLIGSASAADVYASGSLKDGGFASPVSNSRAGFYATGLLGYSWGNRDIDQTITREAGFYKEGKCWGHGDGRHCVTYAERSKEPIEADFDKDGTSGLSTAEQSAFNEAKADHAKFMERMERKLADNPGSTFDGTTFIAPLVGDLLSNGGDADIGGFVYGAEVSYLFHNGGRFGLEPAVGVTFYGDDKGGISHSEALGRFTMPDEAAGETVPGSLSQTGYASAERDYDIDVLLRGYYFVNDRFALTLGGGVSIAKADVCGGNSADGLVGGDRLSDAAISAFNTNGCKSDTSVGPMVEVGFKWWTTDRIAIVGRVDAKWHEFEGDFNSASKLDFAGEGEPGRGLYGNSSNHVEVEDVMYSAKVGVSIKLD